MAYLYRCSFLESIRKICTTCVQLLWEWCNQAFRIHFFIWINKHAFYVYDSMQPILDRSKKRFVDAAVLHNLLHNNFTLRLLLLFENTWQNGTIYFEQWADNICNHVQLVFTISKQRKKKNMWKMCMPFGLLRHMIMTIWNHTTLNWI